MANSTYATALSVTSFDDFSTDIWDLTIGKHKVVRYFKELGLVNKYSGGVNVTKRLEVDTNPNFSSMGAYDTIPMATVEPFTAAVFPWKVLSGSIKLANLVIFQNSGDKHRISNILTDILNNAAHSAMLLLDANIWDDGTGNGGYNFGGIRYLTATSNGTVAGIDSNADTYWRNQSQNANGSFATFGLDALNTLRINCQRNGNEPKIVIAEVAGRVAYEKTLVQQKMLVQANKTAHDLGLDNVEYAGMPFIDDPSQTSGYIDMIGNMELAIGTDISFRKSPMVQPIDEDTKTQVFVLYGNLVTTDRSGNGVSYGNTYP